jgi:hypothetical protein
MSGLRRTKLFQRECNEITKETMRQMNKILISLVLITSLMGCALALDAGNRVGNQPGEAVAQNLFNQGIGQAWGGGNPPSSSSSGMDFSQYYSINQVSGSKNHIEAPKKRETINKLPSTVYFSYQMKAMPYTQFQTYSTYTGGNALWIQGTTSWTQYAQVPQGSNLYLLATSSVGGNGYLYEINPNGILSKNSINFFPGSNQIGFNADSIGQHILLFVINGQVSNSVVVDVVPYVPPHHYPKPIPSIQPYSQGTTVPPMTPIPTIADSTVTISSQHMRGYQVFLDGNYIGTEGTGGDPLDGKFTFKVVGNQNHEVRVFDGQFNYPKTMFFERGGTKIIYVEPGTAIYA